MRWFAGLAIGAMLLTSCATTRARPSTATLEVVASTSAWGSLAQALGGPLVHVRSIVSRPDADPHDYEPTAEDARDIATAGVVIVNGVGYDEWADRIVDANENSAQHVLDVGRLVGASTGDNPHRWYVPDDVRRVVDEISATYARVDAAHAADFERLHATFVDGDLARYEAALDAVHARAGVAVGVTESLFDGISAATGLRVTTPRGFVTATTEGIDPSVQDTRTFETQVESKSISVLVVNPQNETPDVDAVVQRAHTRGIPVVEFTETLVGTSFVDWQVAQLDALRRALAAP